MTMLHAFQIWWKECIVGVLSACILLTSTMLPRLAFADTNLAGAVGQTIGNDKLSMQVTEVNIADNSGQKVVTLTTVFKNLDFKPQLFNVFYMKLKDTDGRQYSPELFASSSFSVGIPSRDTVTASIAFSIPSTSSPMNFYYTELFQSSLIVDLTKSNTPADPLPTSDWILSANKGFVARDSKMELTINDETYSAPYYIIDVTIKNIVKDKVNYNPFYAFAKDQSGKVHSYAIFSNEASPLSSGELASNDFVRGTIAFEMDASKPVMFIWFGDSGFGSYFNTGELKNTPPSPPVSNPPEQAQVVNPVSLSGVSITDFSDNEIVDIHTGASLLMTVTASNLKNTAQPFVAVFEVRDEDGNTVSMQFLKGKISANDSFDLGASWSAEKAGTYTARTFVVTDLKSPQALSPIVQKAMVVR